MTNIVNMDERRKLKLAIKGDKRAEFLEEFYYTKMAALEFVKIHDCMLKSVERLEWFVRKVMSEKYGHMEKFNDLIEFFVLDYMLEFYPEYTGLKKETIEQELSYAKRLAREEKERYDAKRLARTKANPKPRISANEDNAEQGAKTTPRPRKTSGNRNNKRDAIHLSSE